MSVLFEASQGFALGLSLIMAIGAQNAFVLRQGILGAHVGAVALTCAISDAVLVTIGVAGFGWIVESHPRIIDFLTWGGAAFLIVYGAMAFLRAIRPNGKLEAAKTGTQSLGRALATCLALTWLNPHVYLDTVVLLGSLSTQYPHPGVFGMGAVIASFVFFFSLAFGARLLAPVFARPGAWRVLDLFIALVMWTIAAGLLLT